MLAWQQFLAVKLLQFGVPCEDWYRKAKFGNKKPTPRIMFWGTEAPRFCSSELKGYSSRGQE